MKNTYKLKSLLARNPYAFETDKLSFLNRICSEHIFQSTQDCLEYLEIIINNKPINPDNILPVHSSEDYTILKINIIDEAICSIFYEIFYTINRENKNILSYSTKLLEDFRTLLYSKIEEDKSVTTKFFRPLFMIIITIISFCNLPNIGHNYGKEEFYKKQIAKYYYELMYYLYDQVLEKDNYIRTMQNYYRHMFFKHENWL